MKQLIKILEAHGIEVAVHAGIVLAKEWYRQDGAFHYEWIDVTTWTHRDTRNWLGY